MYTVDYTRAVGEGLGQAPISFAPPVIGAGPFKILFGLGILYAAYKLLT